MENAHENCVTPVRQQPQNPARRRQPLPRLSSLEKCDADRVRRRRPIDLDDGIKALVTVHPSYLLRLPDADARTREYARFVDDFRIAAAALRKSARAA